MTEISSYTSGLLGIGLFIMLNTFIIFLVDSRSNQFTGRNISLKNILI